MRRLGKLLGTALAALSLSGCAGFWDEVTSNNFQFNHLFQKPNPFVVLEKSNDGNERAQALRALHEPRENGGSEQDQEYVLKILATAATRDRQFLCRVAAIESLGRFKDPRVVDPLTEAFYSSGSFGPDLALRIQTQAIHALGQVHQEKAEQFLVRLVKEKPRGEGSDQDRQQIMDVRLAAIRALGHYEDTAAVQALESVVQGEKDIALRDCANESILLASGQRPPLIDLSPVGNFFNQTLGIGTVAGGPVGKPRTEEPANLSPPADRGTIVPAGVNLGQPVAR
jgi:hypothetical protein